jgi:hypothetical protein
MRGDDNQPEGSLAACPARSETSGSSVTTDPQNVDEIQHALLILRAGLLSRYFICPLM